MRERTAVLLVNLLETTGARRGLFLTFAGLLYPGQPVVEILPVIWQIELPPNLFTNKHH